MKIIGIGSTAHTLGIGIFDSKKGVLSNEIARYQPVSGGSPATGTDTGQSHSPRAGKG
jgi:tRNA A37 threonylcarbamoyltransferase TsaD